jgi:hypothetical protein
MSTDLELGCLVCPSAPPEWAGARLIGIVGGTADTPRVTPLDRSMPVTPELLALARPVSPTELFRFSAPCASGLCQHFKENACHLATKIVQLLPVISDELPFCTICPSCRWFSQEGKDACYRCPQVVTDNFNAQEAMRKASDPTYTRPIHQDMDF